MVKIYFKQPDHYFQEKHVTCKSVKKRNVTKKDGVETVPSSKRHPRPDL